MEAMLGRLQVDLTEDKVMSCMQCFDLKSWLDPSRHVGLKAHCRILQQVLAVDASVLHELSAAAQAAAPLVKAADGRGIHVCNRLAWSWTLLPQWRSRHTPRVPEPSKGFVRLVCFYLAVKLGTGKLERSLGDLVQQLNNHLGPRSEDGSTMAALVEVCLDGPQTAQDLFVRGDNGVLIPTEFARECAMAWVRCFGRRFHCRYNSQKGRQGGVRLGTFVEAQRRRAAATSKLAKAASDIASHRGRTGVTSFVAGLSLPLPPKDATGQTPPRNTRWSQSEKGSQKKAHPLQRFCAHTERKKESSFGSTALTMAASLIRTTRARRGSKNHRQPMICCFHGPSKPKPFKPRIFT